MLNLDGIEARVKGACLLYGVYTARNILARNAGAFKGNDKEAIFSFSRFIAARSKIPNKKYWLLI